MQLLTSEEGTNVRLAVETLEELDWCLDQVILASDWSDGHNTDL